MSKIELTRKEYLELKDAADKLRLLEGTGVDNWEGYDIALGDFTSDSELYSKAEALLDEISTETEVDFPAGREAGARVTFNETAVERIVTLLRGDKG